MKNSLFFACLFSCLFQSCTKNDKNPIFQEISPSSSGIEFENLLEETPLLNIVNYIYFYNGGGVSAGDINNDGLSDLFFVSNQGKNKLYLNQGNFKFKDISKSAKIEGKNTWSTGVTMVDINNDGYLDIYVSAVSQMLNFKGHNELFINNGDNTFEEKSEEYGLNIQGFCTQSYFFDYDNDDDLDVYIVRHAVHTPESHGPSAIREKRKELVGDYLLENREEKFVDVSNNAGIFGGANGYGLSAAIGDFDNNGFQDIYVCNDFHEDDYYYLNQGNRKFIESLKSNFAYTGRFSMGSDVSDLNNDDQLDIITLDMLPYEETIIKASDGDVSFNVQEQLKNLGYNYQYSRNMLHMNANGQYYEIGQNAKIQDTDWSWSALFADYDNDGHLDLFVSNGIPKRPNNLDFMDYISNQFKTRNRNAPTKDWLIKSLSAMPEGKVPNAFFKGFNGSFANKTKDWSDNVPNISNGATYVDLDNDGDLDIVTNNLNSKASIFKNNLNTDSNYLKIKLNYNSRNYFGIGSRVSLFANGSKKTQQLLLSRGFISSVEPILHFGLGDIQKIDSLIVQWPNNTREKFDTLGVNQLIEINLGEGSTYSEKHQKHEKHENIFLQKANKKHKITFLHSEDDYIDWNISKLSSYEIGKQGPALATTYAGNEKMVYVGNGAGSFAELFIWKNNRFKKLEQLQFLKDSIYEDTYATFFDFDQDGDKDLYVVSGESNYSKEFKKDRLYLNNGNYQFKKAQSAIPKETSFNGSIAKAVDFDKDGFTDIFVGARTNSKYGTIANSILLRNEEGVKFSIAQVFQNLDFVTDAIWHDLDEDGWKDLIIASEWSPIKIYKNNAGKLVLSEEMISNETKGLWQHINLFDINQDGNLDLIAGNWGENTKLQKHIESGISFWIKDFDENGAIDPIICFKNKNKHIPLQSKNILASQLTFLKRKYNSYDEFIGKGIHDIFSKSQIDGVTYKEINTLANGYFLRQKDHFSSFIPFDNKLQSSSINNSLLLHSNKKTESHLITIGNIRGTSPNIGQINSKNGFVISSSKNRRYYREKAPNFFSINRRSNRYMRKFITERDTLILIASNRDSLEVMRYSNSK